MSQIPPPGGWIDPYGTPQPGYPPPGYWQASDGRWYPPESRPGQPFASPPAVAAPQPQPGPYGAPGAPPPGPPGPPGYPGQSPYPAPTQPQFSYSGAPTAHVPTGPPPGPAGSGSGRTGLWVALGVVAALVVVGVGLVAIRGNKTDVTSGSTTTAATVGTTSTSARSLSSSTTTAKSGGAGKDGATVQSCTRKDKGRYEVDITSTLSTTSNFSLTVALLDDSGKRVGDSTAYIQHLRAGEHAVEDGYLADDKGTTCEVVGIDHFDSRVDPQLLADVSACTPGKPSSLGLFAGTLSATNSAKVNSDYNVTVAIVDAKGVRRGTGTSFIKSVRPKETAPGDIFTAVPGGDGFKCEVVGVTRLDS